MSYAWEKFNLAVHTLKGSGSPKDRLIGAFDTIMLLRPEDLPEEKQQAFDRFFQEMTRVAPESNEGPVCATVCDMDDDEVELMIGRLESFQHDLKPPRRLV